MDITQYWDMPFWRNELIFYDTPSIYIPCGYPREHECFVLKRNEPVPYNTLSLCDIYRMGTIKDSAFFFLKEWILPVLSLYDISCGYHRGLSILGYGHAKCFFVIRLLNYEKKVLEIKGKRFLGW